MLQLVILVHLESPGNASFPYTDIYPYYGVVRRHSSQLSVLLFVSPPAIAF